MKRLAAHVQGMDVMCIGSSSVRGRDTRCDWRFQLDVLPTDIVELWKPVTHCLRWDASLKQTKLDLAWCIRNRSIYQASTWQVATRFPPFFQPQHRLAYLAACRCSMHKLLIALGLALTGSVWLVGNVLYALLVPCLPAWTFGPLRCLKFRDVGLL